MVPQSPEEGVRCPGTGVTDSCEPPCRSWEVNPGPPQEQLGLLTTEPSLRPQGPGFKVVSCCSLDWQNQLTEKTHRVEGWEGAKFPLVLSARPRVVPCASQQLSWRPPRRKAGLKMRAHSRFVQNKRRTEMKRKMSKLVFQGQLRL